MLHYGVNYVPSKDWFYSWQNFNPARVDEDFAAISEIGFDHIRMHLRWDVFQPNAAFVSEKHLAELHEILNLAQKHHLSAQVTVLNGWMSGFWFLPSFVWDKNILTDSYAIDAEKFFLEKLTEAVGNHPALLGADLGNEINVYQHMIKDFSVAEGDRWLREMLAYADRLMPNKTSVVGVDHQPWFSDAQFSRSALASAGSMTSLHTWTKFTGALRYGWDSEECLSLGEFCVELADAYAECPSRKVWIQEYGVAKQWMDASCFETYVHESMKRAARCENLWGFTWWCSHDVDTRFTGFNELEYELGLFTTNNQMKPLGRYLKSCIAEMNAGVVAPALQTGPAIVVENGDFDGWRYGSAYAEMLRRGVHAKFVLASSAHETDYLKSRKITELIRL